jgi:hypothetical protein
MNGPIVSRTKLTKRRSLRFEVWAAKVKRAEFDQAMPKKRQGSFLRTLASDFSYG